MRGFPVVALTGYEGYAYVRTRAKSERAYQLTNQTALFSEVGQPAVTNDVQYSRIAWNNARSSPSASSGGEKKASSSDLWSDPR